MPATDQFPMTRGVMDRITDYTRQIYGFVRDVTYQGGADTYTVTFSKFGHPDADETYVFNPDGTVVDIPRSN